MRKLTLMSCALAALATSFVAPAAQAGGPAVDGPDGRKCSYAAVSDPAPDADENAMTGQTNGGPLVWDKDFTLHCTIQVNSNIHNGTSNDAATVSCEAEATPPPGTWTAQCAGTLNYTSPEDAQDYQCTWVTYAGGTLYWHPTEPGPDGIFNTLDDLPGHWTTDPNTPCSPATQTSTGPIIDLLNETVFYPLDEALICPALQRLHNTLGFHGRDPIQPPNPLADTVWIDHEGDVFVDIDGNGINEAGARADMFRDCPVRIRNGDAAQGGIIDKP